MERKKSEAADRIGPGTIIQVSFVICSILLFAGIASADTAGYEQRKQRVINIEASKPILDDDPVFEGGEIKARRALARLAKATDLDGANDYFGNWGPTRDSSQYNDNFTYTYWIRACFMPLDNRN